MVDRPYVLLSCGMSIDGYVDNAAEDRLLLSNDADFDRVDAVRAECDAILVGAGNPAEAIEELCTHAVRTVGAEWGVVVELDPPAELVRHGDAPDLGWLLAFVAGSQSSARVAGGSHGPEDVVWAPLPSAGMALVLGRSGTAFRARERRQAAALARIVDTRFRELSVMTSRMLHPSSS